jgi:ABC-type nickel/cobalt efflux system permease component RcnA
MRLAMWFDAPYVLGENGDFVQFRDENFKERLGWREMVVRAGSGAAIEQSNAPQEDISHELTAYPEDLLNNPPAVSSVAFQVVAGSGATLPSNAATPITVGAIGAFDRTREEFGKLLTTNQELTPTVLLLSLLAAMTLGALHAFSPGHGKAVVGAYLVGSRGNWQHAVFLGLIVTLTHTAGVYALGFVTLFLSAYVLPEQLFPWLGFLSGLLVAIIGVQLLTQRWRAARTQSTSYDQAVKTMRATPQLELAHAHANGSTHVHAYAAPHTHTSEAAHSHSHVFATPEEEAAHAQEHLDELKAFEKPSWKNLVSLGISGGLLPCPSALVVMLSAIALGRVLYGLFLIVGFSLGLASVLVITGLLLLYAGKFAGKHMQGRRVGPLMRYLPIVGALVVTVLGIAIAFEAFFQTGLVP